MLPNLVSRLIYFSDHLQSFFFFLRGGGNFSVQRLGHVYVNGNSFKGETIDDIFKLAINAQK